MANLLPTYSTVTYDRGEDVSLNSEILGKIYKPDVREQTEQTSGLKCLGVNQNEVVGNHNFPSSPWWHLPLGRLVLILSTLAPRHGH